MSTTTGEGGGWPGATGGSVSSGAAAPVVIAEPVPTEFTQATSTAYLLAKSTHTYQKRHADPQTRTCTHAAVARAHSGRKTQFHTPQRQENAQQKT